MEKMSSLIQQIKSRFTPKLPIVDINEEKIICSFSDGTQQSVSWNSLGAVIIETNDLGPWAEDFYWILISRDAKQVCSIPQGAEGEGNLLPALQQLPGFDNEAVISASSCVSNKSFLCWEADDWEGKHWEGIVAARNYR